MTRIHTFNEFLTEARKLEEGDLTPEQIKFLNLSVKYGKWSVNPSTGLVDIIGRFDSRELKKAQMLPNLGDIKFGNVSKDFMCTYNSLKTLENGPIEVGNDFYCDGNDLTSLEGAPRKVGRDFYCGNNPLKSFEGAPEEVGGRFSCDNTRMGSVTTLEGCPKVVKGDFICFNVPLTSLKGAPAKIGGTFYCDHFQLKPGEWNRKGWEIIMETGSPEAKKLISTLL